ncbi:MAG: PTS sugar transporter subunit IIA [Candidatus Berkiella sp.]
MSVGILLITHSGIGGALLNVAHGTFGQLPLCTTHLSVSRDPEPELLLAKAAQLVRKLDSGSGVLVLTDMFGSTPSNIAQGLQNQGFNIRVITGLNVPMLFRILNYPHLALGPLAKKAVDGGKDGIFEPLHEQRILKVANGGIRSANIRKKAENIKLTRKSTIVDVIE